MSSIAFDHIALGLPHIADAAPFLVGVLGGVPHSGMQGGPELRFGTCRYDGGGEIEVIEPVGADGFVHRFLAARGPGIHHVTFKVPDLDEACERARRAVYDVVGYDDSYDDWKTAFLHPKQALGIVVQFAQTSGGSVPSGWKPPATFTNPPAAVTVVGLRMRVSAADRAREQWEGILQGEGAARAVQRLDVDLDGRKPSIVFRWPDSPMVLTIDIDPSASEGPVAIEIASSRSVTLPAGPVRELGTAFRLISAVTPPRRAFGFPDADPRDQDARTVSVDEACIIVYDVHDAPREATCSSPATKPLSSPAAITRGRRSHCPS